jgi:hypothetical protein
MVQITSWLLIKHLKTGFRCRVVWDHHVHRTLGSLLVQFGAHRGTVRQFKVFCQSLLQGEMTKNVPGVRALYLSHCHKIRDASDLDANHTHIVAHVILKHPDESADISLWRIPVNCLGDMRMPALDRGGKLQFFDIANQCL